MSFSRAEKAAGPAHTIDAALQLAHIAQDRGFAMGVQALTEPGSATLHDDLTEARRIIAQTEHPEHGEEPWQLRDNVHTPRAERMLNTNDGRVLELLARLAVAGAVTGEVVEAEQPTTVGTMIRSEARLFQAARMRFALAYSKLARGSNGLYMVENAARAMTATKLDRDAWLGPSALTWAFRVIYGLGWTRAHDSENFRQANRIAAHQIGLYLRSHWRGLLTHNQAQGNQVIIDDIQERP